jgi:hypothetical protein
MSPRSPHRRPQVTFQDHSLKGKSRRYNAQSRLLPVKRKCCIDGLSHRMPLKVIRSLEAVEVLQVTAEPKLKKLCAEHRDPLSLSPAVRQRPHGLAQYGRDDRPALTEYQGDHPQIYPTSRSRKEKNTCKGDLEGVGSEFLPSPLACNEVPCKLHWKVTPREVLRQQIQGNIGFPPSLFRSDDLGTQDLSNPSTSPRLKTEDPEWV